MTESWHRRKLNIDHVDTNLSDRARSLLEQTDKLSWPERVTLLEHWLTPAACRRLGIYALPEGFVLSVIMPVYNEVTTVESVVQKVRETRIPVEIVLVNDGSTDGSGELLNRLAIANNRTDVNTIDDMSKRTDESKSTDENVRVDDDGGGGEIVVVHHEVNRGKGAAIRTGFAKATGSIVIVQDADLEYSPDDYRRLLQPILEDRADVVYGSRFTTGPRLVARFWHQNLNRLITLLSNTFTNLKLTDVETCYKVFRRDVLLEILPDLREDGFGIELEITARLARRSGTRFYECPISYRGRSYAEGKKISWRDAIRAFWCILRY